MMQWGNHNVAEILGLARSSEPAAARGRWPRPRTLGRILAFALLTLILGGWLLSVITSLT